MRDGIIDKDDSRAVSCDAEEAAARGCHRTPIGPICFGHCSHFQRSEGGLTTWGPSVVSPHKSTLSDPASDVLTIGVNADRNRVLTLQLNVRVQEVEYSTFEA